MTSLLQESGQTPVRICLYVAVSPEMEYRPISMGPFARVKRFVGRQLDVASWFLKGPIGVRFHHWNTHNVTNKGDIAIREAVKEQLRLAFAPRQVVFTQIPWGHLDVKNAGKVGAEHDLFVIAGSGYIFSHSDGNIDPRAYDDRVFLEALTCPKIAYGVGWNKLLQSNDFGEARPLTEQTREVLRSLFGALDLVSVRDRATQQLLEELVGRKPVLCGDPALFYRGTGQARKYNDGKLHVGLNLALHGKESVERISRQHSAFCEFLREFAKRHDVVYHYVQHSHTERGIPLLLRAGGISVRREDVSPSELPSLYGSLDLHVCQMLHSAILAVGANVPTLHFAYDVKSAGFFDIMQMPQYCHPDWPFDPQQRLADLESIHSDAGMIRDHIAGRKKEIWTTVESFLAEIATLVANAERASLRNPQRA